MITIAQIKIPLTNTTKFGIEITFINNQLSDGSAGRPASIIKQTQSLMTNHQLI